MEELGMISLISLTGRIGVIGNCFSLPVSFQESTKDWIALNT